MYTWFYIFVLGIIIILPLYFLSLEHIKLDEKYGKERGKKISAIFGIISGWSFFLFWFGIWISPQPRFFLPLFHITLTIPFLNVDIYLFNLIISIPFIILSFWFGIVGVKGTTLETAETHRAKEIVDDGIYSIIRHPQYLGGLIGHIGITVLLSALYSLIFFPFMVLIIYFISKKEEKELIKDFGEEYEKYRNRVPMFIPRLRRTKKEI